MDPNPSEDRPRIPRRASVANDSSTRTRTHHRANSSPDCCCCGPECVEHGLTLRSLEKDVREAARVGQALLVRHETYVAESEAERSRLSSQVSRLEIANQNLEAQNAQLFTENSALLNQLDETNNAVHESDAQIQSLTATLHSTQRELEKLARLVARTESLEAQLLECEKEQARLQATLTRSNEEERGALQRWRSSQRRIVELEQQLEDIEREAREERLRHEEVEARFERRRALEKELDTYTALVTDDKQEKKNSEVVSSFVKEILQDNANMQLAMVELHDLLAYYKEAELIHRKQEHPEYDDVHRLHHPSLGEELGPDQEQTDRQIHVHHHYHAPPPVGPQRQPRSRSQQGQRAKKRRPVLVSGRSTPVNTAQSPHRPPNRHKTNNSISSSVGSFDNGVSKQKRWSAQSTQSQSSIAVSSDLSSPRSASYCPSTIFEQDLADGSTEYSRPTSPESNAIWSPSTKPARRNDSSFQNLSSPSKVLGDDDYRPRIENSISTISENSNEQISELQETERGASPKRPTQSRVAAPITPSASPTRNLSPRRSLRRADSHMSLFSISGMDIHSTLPSPAHPPLKSQTLSRRQHSGAVLSAATASAINSSHGSGLVMLNRSLQGSLTGNGTDENTNHYAPIMDTFGKRVGGWLTARWAGSTVSKERPANTGKSQESDSAQTKKAQISSIPEVDEPYSKLAGEQTGTMPVTIETKSLPEDSLKEKLSFSISPRKPSYRPPGINQVGGLPPLPLPGGFRSIGKVPITKMVDAEALRECLEDDHPTSLSRGVVT